MRSIYRKPIVSIRMLPTVMLRISFGLLLWTLGSSMSVPGSEFRLP